MSEQPRQPQEPLRPRRDHFGRNYITTYTYNAKPRAVVEHDEAAKRFVVTDREDGSKVAFHDRAVRFLVVEPNGGKGGVSPVLESGEPRIIYLCREADL